MKKKIIGFVLIVLMIGVSFANAEMISWNPSTGVVKGYTLYFGPSSNPIQYTRTVPSDVTSIDFVLLNIPYTVEYKYVVKAYNDQGESGPSNEVTYTRPPYQPPPDLLPPVLSGVPGDSVMQIN